MRVAYYLCHYHAHVRDSKMRSASLDAKYYGFYYKDTHEKDTQVFKRAMCLLVSWSKVLFPEWDKFVKEVRTII